MGERKVFIAVDNSKPAEIAFNCEYKNYSVSSELGNIQF